MRKKIEEMTIDELRTRADEIRAAVSEPDADLEVLEKEADEIQKRLRQNADEQRRLAIAGKVAHGAGAALEDPTGNSAEARAAAFVQDRRETIDCEEARALLVSGGKLATPTAVSGINDRVGAKVSSIVDLVKIVNCEGMGSNKVAYEDVEADEADDQTEGSSATTKEGTFGFVEIKPTSVAVLSQISKQAKKQTPLIYEAKVREQSLNSLRKRAAAEIAKKMQASTLVSTIDANLDSGKKGVVDATTLRKLALAYGGDESVVGGAYLLLNKADLIAFGDVRGTNEKKAVYEITPDTDNPNTGIIKDGGLSVRYCLMKALTACAGTAQTSAVQKTMFYGVPTCFELDLFSDYEISVSSDFAFDKRMDTILGDVDLGGDVVVKGGFVALSIPASA